MMKHDIHVQAGIHDSLSNSVSEMYNINYLGTSFVAMQGAFPLKVGREAGTKSWCRWCPPLGLKDALASTSRHKMLSAMLFKVRKQLPSSPQVWGSVYFCWFGVSLTHRLICFLQLLSAHWRQTWEEESMYDYFLHIFKSFVRVRSGVVRAGVCVCA